MCVCVYTHIYVYIYIYIYIYIYLCIIIIIIIIIIFFSFSRRFYPKRLTNEDIIEAIKTNKRATTCKCYYKSWLA